MQNFCAPPHDFPRRLCTQPRSRTGPAQTRHTALCLIPYLLQSTISILPITSQKHCLRSTYIHRYHRISPSIAIPKILHGTLAQGCNTDFGRVIAPQIPSTAGGFAPWVVRWSPVLTISRLSRWSINYYNDTANQAQAAAMDRQAAGGGLGEYYSERDTRVPTWVVAGDSCAVGDLIGLDGAALDGGFADTEVAGGGSMMGSPRTGRRAGVRQRVGARV